VTDTSSRKADADAVDRADSSWPKSDAAEEIPAGQGPAKR
jgi:hypothetical protein